MARRSLVSLVVLAFAAGCAAQGAPEPGRPVSEIGTAHHHQHTHANVIASRVLDFPDTADGRKVLAVDLHTHSVFSDGHVWPTVRTWEAERDGLAAFAVTEHLEYQPHRDDIPHPDRNRSFELAAQSALEDGDGLIVIPGVEVTRKLPPGHVNAVFIRDANPILTIDSWDQDHIENARVALKEAQGQGAFTFWNHPYWERDFPNGVLVVPDAQKRLVHDGLINGIEVANGRDFSEETYRYALDEGLVILGTSDIHGLIDYDYDIDAGEHRTVTLALAKERSAEGIKNALIAGDTTALFMGNIIGRQEQVEAVVLAALHVTLGPGPEGTKTVSVTIRNDAPVRMMLNNLGARKFRDSGDLVILPPNSERTLVLTGGAEQEGVTLPVEVLNAYVGPQQKLRTELKP